MTLRNLGDLPVLPLPESFALTAAYNDDQFPNKVNLGQGVYRDNNCQPWVLPSVREAEETLHNQQVNHEYLPIAGDSKFLTKARQLLFGPQIASSAENISSLQTVAGTGANHLAALFCARNLCPKNVFISDPTWDNHHLIWEMAAPNVTQRLYPYYDPTTRGLNLDGMLAELESSAEDNDVVILHACAHNPTGIDPTREQWKKIAQVVRRKKLFVVFDCAYQGFASGDADADAWAIREFYSMLFTEESSSSSSSTPAGMFVCQSLSKNFGLYGERIGALHLIIPPWTSPEGAKAHLVQLVRAEISCPSLFGARIVHTVLDDAELCAKWQEDVRIMALRIKTVRALLKSELEKIGARGDWSHIEQQIGMFSFTGLSSAQVQELRERHHIYMLSNGRMSLSGLNETNVAYVAGAIRDVL
ncbi:Aspartate aminotransferase, cytoplasmic [Talaromyces pinophilus]|nr:Aspartate aminotransferase, cytoplasmic [Talaromyces pinophilus]